MRLTYHPILFRFLPPFKRISKIQTSLSQFISRLFLLYFYSQRKLDNTVYFPVPSAYVFISPFPFSRRFAFSS